MCFGSGSASVGIGWWVITRRYPGGTAGRGKGRDDSGFCELLPDCGSFDGVPSGNLLDSGNDWLLGDDIIDKLGRRGSGKLVRFLLVGGKYGGRVHRSG